jgi:signal transduction histidine kinase
MLAALEETGAEVRRSEDELRVLFEREKGTRQELEEETKKRTEFTRALVHELRTPITPVLAATEMLLDSSLDSQSRRLVESIDRSASNLNRRIDELIDLIRGETDMLPLVNAPVNIVSLLRDLGDEMAPVATAEGHRLTVDLPPSRVDVWGDSDRLRQVVQNLMNNAIKFTPAGGEIALLARLDGDRLVVEVHDSGPGIAEEDMVRLFDPYYRRVEDRERLSGLGLGLALAKKLVELHGGEIWVKSRPGEGTTLGFSLPLMGDADNGGDGNQVTE